MSYSPEFQAAFTAVVGDEGGYVNDPRDPGGETKFGVAKKYHPDVDIRALKLTDAMAIYHSDYWLPAGCENLNFPVAYVYFDAVVNMGLGTATRLMQEALGETADGKVGPRTRAALKKQSSDSELIVKFQAERALYYASRGHFDRFGRGWLRRVIRAAMFAVSEGADK